MGPQQMFGGLAQLIPSSAPSGHYHRLQTHLLAAKSPLSSRLRTFCGFFLTNDFSSLRFLGSPAVCPQMWICDNDF